MSWPSSAVGEPDFGLYVIQIGYGCMPGIEAYGDLPMSFRARHSPASAITVIDSPLPESQYQ
jgi:hypothetical protein